MSQASFKQKKREGKSPSASPDGGSFPRDSKLKVDKHDGRERTNAGNYESQSQLNRDQKSSIIKYQ